MACKGKSKKTGVEAHQRSCQTTLLLDLRGRVRAGDKSSNSSSLTGREICGPEVLSPAGLLHLLATGPHHPCIQNICSGVDASPSSATCSQPLLA